MEEISESLYIYRLCLHCLIDILLMQLAVEHHVCYYYTATL